MKTTSGGAMLLLLGGVIGVIIGVAIGIALLSYAYPVFQSDKWAAWVQAVGSIGAIFSAIAIASYQNQKREKRIEKNRIASEAAFFALLEDCVESLWGIATVLEDGSFTSDKESFRIFDQLANKYRDKLRTLRAVPVFDSNFTNAFLSTKDTRSFLESAEYELTAFLLEGGIIANKAFNVGALLKYYHLGAKQSLMVVLAKSRGEIK